MVLGTGGTIAGTADAGEAAGYGAARVGAAALVAGLSQPASVAVEAEQVAQVDSKDMDGATWSRLVRRIAHHAARDEVAGIVVAHGTDTLEETAWLLERTVGRLGKPIVLTGAMRPADAADADGPRNLADAVAAAADPALRGVVVAFAGSRFAARGLRKRHTRAADAFAGRAPGEDRNPRGEPVDPARLPADAAGWPWVEVVASGALVDGRTIDALTAAGVDGLVVATTGNGTVHAALEAALERAASAGVAILRATRVAEGGIAEPNGDHARWPDAGDLSPAQARVELLLRRLGTPVHALMDGAPIRG